MTEVEEKIVLKSKGIRERPLIFQDVHYSLVKFDELNYVIVENKKYRKYIANPQAERLRPIGYYATLMQAFQKLIELEIENTYLDQASLQGVYQDLGVVLRDYVEALRKTVGYLQKLYEGK